jgi:DNA-binding beta-propeller fold protein YncE
MHNPRRLFVSTLAVAAVTPGLACEAYDELPSPPPGLVVQEVPPPAISGGTLLVTKAGLAVMADADRDRVWIVDPAAKKLRAEVLLQEGDEPGRLAEDGDGRVHVALRAGGALVTFDPSSGEILGRRDVCPAPRGLAYDEVRDAIYVACAGGELVTLPAAKGDAVGRLRLDADLRDVVVDGGQLVVSRFRAAEVLVLDAEGAVARRTQPARFVPTLSSGQEFSPTVAWRMVSMPGGGVVLSHQRSMNTQIVLSAPAYYSAAGCDSSIVHAAVTVMRNVTGGPGAGDALPAATVPFAPLPVDIAVSPDGNELALISAGSDQVFISGTGASEDEAGIGDCSVAMQPRGVPGQPVAAAYSASGELLIQTREPAALVLDDGTTVPLPADSRWDTGHDLFHRSPNQFAPTSVACASCHPEGREDGHTWAFDIGMRRTQTVGGGVLGTAPLHWDGDLADVEAMVNEVLVRRMSGEMLGPRKINAFAHWIDALPLVPTSPPADAEAAARGKALFDDAVVGCASCHSGDKLTNHENADVGTGKAFQVPSLVGVAHRGPFMHDGCAPTLRARFEPGACGGGDAHGKTSHLDEGQISDLVAYLDSL